MYNKLCIEKDEAAGHLGLVTLINSHSFAKVSKVLGHKKHTTKCILLVFYVVDQHRTANN